MADRVYVAVIQEEIGASGARGLRLAVSEDARSLNVRWDSTYDSGDWGTGRVGLTISNSRTVIDGDLILSGAAIYLGADWDELAGNGQTFTWTTAAPIHFDFYARTAPGFHRVAPVPVGDPKRPIFGNARGTEHIAQFTIGTDGWLTQESSFSNNDWTVTLRPPTIPPDDDFHYTTRDKVEVVLRSPTNQYSGWEASFGNRVGDVIRKVQDYIDAQLGTTFRPATGATSRMFQVGGRGIVRTADIDGSQNVNVSVDGTLLSSTDYTWDRPWPRYDVLRDLTATASGLYRMRSGSWLEIQGRYGWPSVPDDVTEYATTLAAMVFRAADFPFGVLDIGTYARTAGKDVSHFLGHYRRKTT